jgi:hypothetical protein
VRINVGLSSRSRHRDGKRSPRVLASGYDIRVNKRSFLPQGQRPCA